MKKKLYLCHEEYVVEDGNFGCLVLVHAKDDDDVYEVYARETGVKPAVETGYTFEDEFGKAIDLAIQAKITDKVEIKVLSKYLPVYGAGRK